MHFLLKILLCSAFFVQAQATYPVREIYQFPNTTFTDIENIAVRPNGNLMLNIISSPVIYQLNPSAVNPSPALVHQFTNATSLTGIAQTSSDVYAVVVGKYNISTFAGIPGSFAIWSVDMNPATPIVTEIASIPGAHALNGMTTIDGSPTMLLIADSALGAVWSLDITNGQYNLAIEDPTFGPTASFPLGINGVHTKSGTLYFTNSAQGLFAGIPISATGQATGKVFTIDQDVKNYFYDDFAIDPSGKAWVTNHPNAVEEIIISAGYQTTIANSTEFVQPTSAAFGTGAGAAQCQLYVVTGGSASKTSIVSGQVFVIDTC